MAKHLKVASGTNGYTRKTDCPITLAQFLNQAEDATLTVNGIATVVLKEPYDKDGKPSLKTASIVYQNTHPQGFRPSCLWALNQAIAERNALYAAIAAEQKAAREAEKEAKRKAREEEKARKQKAREAGKGNGKANGKPANGNAASKIDLDKATAALKNRKNGNGKGKSEAHARLDDKRMTAKAKAI